MGLLELCQSPSAARAGSGQGLLLPVSAGGCPPPRTAPAAAVKQLQNVGLLSNYSDISLFFAVNRIKFIVKRLAMEKLSVPERGARAARAGARTHGSIE